MEAAIIGSIISAMVTGTGAIPILFMRNVTHSLRDILLAYTAGVMVAASMFGLIPEALGQSNLAVFIIGITLGTLTLLALEFVLPHIEIEDMHFTEGIEQKAMLVIAAITLHNLPEGLSVGVSYASQNESLGGLIAFAIGIQNAPEGFLVALFLVNQNIGKWKALGLATLVEAVKIITALVGYFASSYVSGLVPYGLSFAAGAMLFIVYKELIPESHGDGHARTATVSFITGVVTMIYLLTVFY
ncbi:ZIP family metal transporter [Bacillus sp. 165]|uniref:ZIP family metal transporter n=1 Tax=Bacillus sp. 165 TaxID=1529117 RepID=UPI001ADC5529|nr:ZIP family metal transporter [Bacillus sp. 165]MBO9129844.1 ZIP family metal transporter [Bacillus sp. 165]